MHRQLAPLKTRSSRSLRSKRVKNRETGEETQEEVTLSKDEGNRPGSTAETLGAVESGCRRRRYYRRKRKPALRWRFRLHVLMEGKLAEQQGLTPLGIYRGMAVAGNAPEEMGVGPIYAIPKLTEDCRSSHRATLAFGNLTKPLPARFSIAATILGLTQKSTT